MQVGLGTDCSGGFSPSLLNSMRMAVMASNTLTFSDSSYQPLQYSDAVYLATRGGARLTGMEDRLGALRQNMLADFLLVDMTGESQDQMSRHLPSEIISINSSTAQYSAVWR